MPDVSDRLRRQWNTGPMAHGSFRFLIAGQFTSNIGDLCYAVALPWLILSQHDSPVLLGVVLAFYGVPRVVGLPVGGWLADRFGARAVMICADSARCVVVTTLGVLAITSTPQITTLAPIAFLLGLGEGLFMPASYVVLPTTLPEQELTQGNSIYALATQLGTLIGPAIGGVLVASSGPGPTLFVDASSFAISAITVFAMGSVRWVTATADGAADSPTADSPTFAEVLRRGRLLHVVLVVALVGNLVFAGSFQVALPVLAHRHFGAGGYGTLLALLGAGAIGGALLAHSGSGGQRPPRLIVSLGFIMAMSIGGVPFAGGLAGAAVCITIFGAANTWSSIIIVTMLQVWTPRAVLGRVMSVISMATMGTYPISVAVAGVTLRHVGVNSFFPAAGGAIGLAVIVAVSQSAFRKYRTGDHYSRASSGDNATLSSDTASQPEQLRGRFMEFDALSALRAAGFEVDQLASAHQQVFAELTEHDVTVLNRIKRSLDAVSAEVEGQELKLF